MVFLDAASNEHLSVAGRSGAVPEPREDDDGGFAEAGGDIDELRRAGSARVAARQPLLVVVGRVPSRRLEELPECHHLPPAYSIGGRLQKRFRPLSRCERDQLSAEACPDCAKSGRRWQAHI